MTVSYPDDKGKAIMKAVKATERQISLYEQVHPWRIE